MPLANFTQDEIEQFYRIILDRARFHHVKGNEYRARCVLHGGDNENSFWTNLDTGCFCCFACGAKGGGIYSFAQTYLRNESVSGQAPETGRVTEWIHGILGTPFTQRVYTEDIGTKPTGNGWNRKQAQDFYSYQNELGQELYRVWRFVDGKGGKITPPDHPCPRVHDPNVPCEEPGCVDGRVWGAKGVRRVLYRFPDVLQSILVFIVEGESDVNNLSRALARHISKRGGFKLGKLMLDRVAVTTNMGGAGGWKPEHEYGKYFIGKIVVKLGDNDEAGRLHNEAVCKDVSRYASQLFTLELPVPDKEDISYFLKQNGEQGIENLIKLLESDRRPYVVAKSKIVTVGDVISEPRIVLVHPLDLVNLEVKGDWLVEGLIERGQRGLVVAPPKVGKSLMFLDLAVALASMGRFLGAKAYWRPVRTAIISREDGPELVRRRLSQLAMGRNLTLDIINPYILVNTVKQSSSFHIDSQKELEEMAEWLKAGKIEFTIIDVLNRLHFQKENSSDDMTQVMLKFDELAALSGSQICVIHHLARAGNVKGSTSIEGWADFICKLEADATNESIKTVSIRTKATGLIEPRAVRYSQSDDMSRSSIILVVKTTGANSQRSQPPNGNGEDTSFHYRN